MTIAATKYTCIVKTSPASKAGQLKPTIRLDANISMLMLRPNLTISHTMNAKALEIAFALDSFDVIPRASSAAGKATTKLPYVDDKAVDTSKTIRLITPTPTAAINIHRTTRHGEMTG